MKDEQAKLEATVEEILNQAIDLGATDAEVAVSHDEGLSATVRMQEVDTVEFYQDREFGVTVYLGQKKGTATTSDTSKDSIDQTLQAALNIAKYTAEDEYAGLPDKAQLATEIRDCDLYHPADVQPDQAIEKAMHCEALALDKDKRISNSDGASFSTYQSLRAYGNTHDFIGGYATTRHSLDCCVVAESDGQMQRDSGYTMARSIDDLWSAETVAKEASDKVIARLNAKQLKTQKVPVMYHSNCAGGLVNNLLSAISGGAIYRDASFLVGAIGEQIFPDFVQIEDDPFLLKGFGSGPFDSEGGKVQHRHLVKDGVLQGYLLSTYSARRLKMQSTGNAGGAHNVIVSQQDLAFDALLKQMDTGLLVTETIGQGVNIITGDYSRGVNGFWVENGEIQFPVEEITVASNLKDMFRGIFAIGNDTETRSSTLTGSILIDEMMIAGA